MELNYLNQYRGIDIFRKEGKGVFYEKDPYSFLLDIDGQNYVFLPSSFIEKGKVGKDGLQHFAPSVLTSEFDEKFSPNSQFVEIDKLKNKDLISDLRKHGFEDTQGYIVRQDTFDELFSNISNYDPKTFSGPSTGIRVGAIQGLGEKDGQRVYVSEASGQKNAQAYINYNQNRESPVQINTTWYDPGNKLLRNIGYALITVGTAGLAGFGPLAGTTAAAGTAPVASGSIVGTPGVSTIYPVAAPVAPVVTPIAPIAAGGTSIGLLDGVNFSGIGETGITPGTAGTTGFTPPTTPSVSAMGGASGVTVPVAGGTVTQAGLIPAGAVPVLGDPSSFINNPDVLGRPVIPTEATGISATDALRALNQARGLLGAGQNPAVPQQPLAQRPRQGVDVLTLPQLTARTPGVSSLLAPTQLQAKYQPTLLPNVFSLLG